MKSRSADQRLRRVAANRRGPSAPTNGRPRRPPTGRGRGGPRRRSRPRPATTARPHAERRPLLRRGLAVVGVEVPAAAGGFGAVHEHVVPAAGVAVEVLHAAAVAAAPLRPGAKSLIGVTKPRAWQDLEIALGRERHEVAARGARGRMADGQRLAYLRKRLAVGVGAARSGTGRRVRRPGGASPTAPGAPSAGGTAAARRRPSTRSAAPAARRRRGNAGRADRRTASVCVAAAPFDRHRCARISAPRRSSTARYSRVRWPSPACHHPNREAHPPTRPAPPFGGHI